MSLSTITISGTAISSKTFPAPSELQPYAAPTINTFIPIQGEATIQLSNDVDTYGDKNTYRQMVWEAMPTTGNDWTGTVAELKSLEGEDAVLEPECTPYSTAQNIKVGAVEVGWIANNGTDDIWTVTVSYFHR